MAIKSRRLLLKHRAQLVSTLADFQGGKASHLSIKERELVIASIKQRIADLNSQLKEAEMVKGPR